MTGFIKHVKKLGIETYKERSVASEEMANKVMDIVSEQLSVDRGDITLESKFIEDLKADSLDLVELVMEFEDEFDIRIPDEDYSKIVTVQNAVEYIEGKS